MFDEREILEFWKKNKIFEKSVAGRKSKKPFIFFEGPPTANNVPHMGHFETRVFKDVILRYKTMRGYYVPRRAGWDTQGLPVEVEVEKTLGFKNKKDIEAYGIAAFNKKCRESVWKYKEVWERLTARMGFWIDMAHPYITYENSYIESLWWVIKEFARKNYLYEDYKVLPWCARCGTALSSHELAQGYEKVKEESVYVKFKLKNPGKLFGEDNNSTPNPLPLRRGGSEGGEVYFLAWTTTPWTLPGNVALAINPKVKYVKIENVFELQRFERESSPPLHKPYCFILAKDIFEAKGTKMSHGTMFFSTPFKIVEEIDGKDLVGIEYEPLYPNQAPYKVVAGDFVSTEEGMGIVHIAPAFGEDDFRLSKKYDLPVLATTNERGLMQTPGHQWNGEWFKKANKQIIEDLKSRGLLFKTESYEHDYPFCWRCKNPLMYFARKAWWVDVNKVRPKLIKNNETINWYPEHIKRGRFGEWLKEKKNWAFSRERYWGTPLPVWRCETCKKWQAVGSLEELDENATVHTKFIVMRHGEVIHNIKKIVNPVGKVEDEKDTLTQKGIRDVVRAGKALKKEKIEMIFSSPSRRAMDTAAMIAREAGVDEKHILTIPEFRDMDIVAFEGKKIAEYEKSFPDFMSHFILKPKNSENLREVRARMMKAVSDIKSKYAGKNILIVSHGHPTWMLVAALSGLHEKEYAKSFYFKPGQFKKIDLHNWPYNAEGELDMHKPYIDAIFLKCKKCGGKMRRVSEICDVWLDSGAMPFAQWHYPFERKLEYPADYIVEAVDQTRGWFYNLLSVGTLLGKTAPYKNVISLGHVLDSKGKKMSKSLGNVVDPFGLIDKYGADPVRWYFFTINQPWDSKFFNEADIKDASRRFFVILWNVLQFWKMYGTWRFHRQVAVKPPKTKLLINKWALLKLQEITHVVGEKLDSYDIVGAARELENFVTEDVSRWYVRRIRDVMKENSPEAKETGAVLSYLLAEISKLLAPFAPFTAEKIWMELQSSSASSMLSGTSVHLEDWPKFVDEISKSDRHADFRVASEPPELRGRVKREKISMPRAKLQMQILDNMAEVRRIVGLALEARQKLGIKVRQPLGSLSISVKNKALGEDYLALIKEEINVKEIKFLKLPANVTIALDTNITTELREEGMLRDLIREIQSARKTAGLTPKDKVSAVFELPKEMLEVAKKYEKTLVKETNLKSVRFSESSATKILLK